MATARSMRVGVLVSGQGTNLQALLDAQARGELAPAEIALVLCNRPGAPALDRARRAGVATAEVDHRAFPDRGAFEQAMLGELRAAGVEAVVLAGFMRILTEQFVSAFPHRILNTHPALCPAFPGVDAPRQALEHGVKITGCTVHLVDTGVDTGPIVAQAAVPVLEDDTPATLHDRIRAEEHALLPRATRLLAEGRLAVVGRTVRILPPT
ncbi:MAG TPA: phosphoribosylglycinamide formyltransferase [Kofleriaceae bacterium]|nr:phosphoribosylglycinamide formyltransferase [Kofleriaceae bacterium]